MVETSLSPVLTLLTFLATLTSLGLALAFLLKEPHHQKQRFRLRLLLISLAHLVLFLLAIRPEIRLKRDGHRAVLMTGRTNPEDVQAYLDSTGRETRLFAADASLIQTGDFDNLKTIPDMAYLVRNFPDVTELTIFGQGLPHWELQALQPLKVRFHPGMPSPGIRNISWGKNLRIGQALTVEGSVLADSAWRQLVFSGPEGKLDSMALGTEPAPFRFSVIPKDTGRVTYSLCLDGPDSSAAVCENLDVSIDGSIPLRILIVESAPNFETRYLKNWLGEMKHAIAIKSKISLERFRFEYVNHEQIDLRRLVATVLSRFDLIIFDTAAYLELSSTERRHIRNQVESNGLGLLFLADKAFFSPGLTSPAEEQFVFGFKAVPLAELSHLLVKVRLGDGVTLAPEVEAHAFEIHSRWAMQPIVRDQNDRIIAGVNRRGSGKIGFSLVYNSFKWLLDGQPEQYAQFWTEIVETMAKEEASSDSWTIASEQVPCVDKPISLQLESPREAASFQVTSPAKETTELNPEQDPANPLQWTATFWPKEAGWHTVGLKNGKPFSFYVSEEASWKAVRENEAFIATRRFALTHSPAERAPDNAAILWPLPLPWLFGCLLVCLATLWAERRL